MSAKMKQMLITVILICMGLLISDASAMKLTLSDKGLMLLNEYSPHMSGIKATILEKRHIEGVGVEFDIYFPGNEELENSIYYVFSPEGTEEVFKGVDVASCDAFELKFTIVAVDGSTSEGKWSNLGVHMARIIKRAGLETWPKLFQNLRSTRETELFKMTGGNVKAVCSWIGNSPQVAMTHYAQVTEADMKEAAKMTVLNDGEKTVQNTVQPMAEMFGKVQQEDLQVNDISPFDCRNLPQHSDSCLNKTKDIHWALLDLNQ